MEGAGEAAGVLSLIEQSALGQAARNSSWVYPVANIGHVLGVMIFFTAVAVMDLRMLGAFQAVSPGSTIAVARAAAIPAFVLVGLTGVVLFASEAVTLAKNTVFLAKLSFIGLGAANAALFEWFYARRIAAAGPMQRLPAAVKIIAAASLAIWLAAAAGGRAIAYF